MVNWKGWKNKVDSILESNDFTLRLWRGDTRDCLNQIDKLEQKLNAVTDYFDLKIVDTINEVKPRFVVEKKEE